MAFTAITAAEISSGKPNKNGTWEKVRQNFNDHESRIAVVEAAANTFRPIQFELSGTLEVADGLAYERINFDANILSAKLWVPQRGASGTLVIDIEVSTNGGSVWNSIFATLPSVAFADGDFALSSNEVLAITSLSAGDILRINTDAVQTGDVIAQGLVEIEQA